MATIEFEETTSSAKSAAILGGCALVLCILKMPTLIALLMSALIGALHGAANLWLLSKMKPERMTASNWIGMLVLVAAVFFLDRSGSHMTALQAFALGCICVASRFAVFAFFKQSVLDALNKKYGRALAVFDDDEPKVSKITFKDVNPAHEEFLAVLPADLRGEFRACITQATLAKHSESAAKPFQSALGGAPILPPEVSWPMWGEIPLDYLGRINLAELPPSDVPRPASGILEFFYGSDAHEQQPWGGDEEDRGSSAVVFIPEPETAVHPTMPETASTPPSHIPLTFETAWVMAETEAMNDRFYEFARPLHPDRRARVYAVRDAKDEFEPCGHHRVLSAPARVQGDMDDELARAARLFGLPTETSWVMLLQLESDKAMNWQWCDDGAIYFWVPTADLARGRFDRVWVILQSP